MNSNTHPEILALMKALTGRRLTEAEDALVKSIPEEGGYLLPQAMIERVKFYRNRYKSVSALCDRFPTTVLVGTALKEDLSKITELSEIDGVNDIPEEEAGVGVVSYNLKKFAGLLPVTNGLVMNEPGYLANFIAKWVARKAILTENKKIFELLRVSKPVSSPVSYSTVPDFIFAINDSLSAGVADNSVIITNKSFYRYLKDKSVDMDGGNGLKWLKPNPDKTTRYLFDQHPLYIFDESELPNVNGNIPFIVGDIFDAVLFICNDQYKIDYSGLVEFRNDTTLFRVIHNFQPVIGDISAYFYCELTQNAG